jgi:hypothetical protein
MMVSFSVVKVSVCVILTLNSQIIKLFKLVDLAVNCVVMALKWTQHVQRVLVLFCRLYESLGIVLRLFVKKNYVMNTLLSVIFYFF